MFKETVKRGALGFPLGICIGYVVTLMISLAVGDGSYHPFVPSLIEGFGSEIAAVLFQTALCGVLGAAFGASSVIWEMEKWSIAKQTAIYFLIVSIVMLPIAYLAHWMDHSIAGFFFYFAIFAGMFLVIWVIQYFIWRNKIKGMNRIVDDKRKS